MDRQMIMEPAHHYDMGGSCGVHPASKLAFLVITDQKLEKKQRGNEVILTYDAATLKIRRVGVGVDRVQALQIYEKIMGADTMELCHVDYSFKPLKSIVTMEQPVLEHALLATHIPLFYGAMPNLGIYSQPDGPFPNPAELMPAGKIDAAKESYEQTVAEAVKDIVLVASCMYESGADGINAECGQPEIWWPACK